MLIGLFVATAFACVLLCIVTLVQVLYMETLRLHTREMPMLTLFKSTLEERIRMHDAHGALAFSIIKHTVFLIMVLLCTVIAVDGHPMNWRAFGESAGVSWLLMLASTYIAPHLLYRKTAGTWLLKIAPFLRLLALMAKPLTALLAFFQSLVELAEPENGDAEAASASDHIDAIIAAGAEEGILEEGDRKLIESVVAFGDKTVREVMTPRPNMVTIEENRSLDDLRELVINEQYSRIPVYAGNIDQITGFVHVRDMFELDEQERKGREVKELARPIRLVPETKPVDDLLREMQQDGAHMAVVVDEYGNTAGLVTMEDLVEEILGEIHDEHEPERDVTPEPDGSYVMSGSLDVDRLHDLFEFRPQEETESTTVGGLVTEWLGHVPRPGEAIEREGIRIEVLNANDTRVEQVRVARAEKPETSETRA